MVSKVDSSYTSFACRAGGLSKQVLSSLRLISTPKDPNWDDDITRLYKNNTKAYEHRKMRSTSPIQLDSYKPYLDPNSMQITGVL